MIQRDVRGGRATVVTALLAVQVFFGVHYVAAKILLDEFEPRAWALIRAACAAVVLIVGAWLLRRRFPTKLRDWLGLAGCSLFGVAANQLLFIEGLSRTTPTHSAIINTTIPVLTLAFAVLLGRERISGRKVAALAVALTGVLLVLWPREFGLGSETLVGDLLTLANSASFSFFLVISKRLLERLDPIAATGSIFCFGSIVMAFFCTPAVLAQDYAGISKLAWLNAAFIVLIPTAGAYFLNYWALGRVDSSVVALFIYCQPVLAAGLSALTLGERPGVNVFAGAALIFAGVYLAVMRKRRAAAAQPE